MRWFARLGNERTAFARANECPHRCVVLARPPENDTFEHRHAEPERMIYMSQDAVLWISCMAVVAICTVITVLIGIFC